uniref:Uncharacterized protein n=1 Tax=viral metagenome TaxID=1070528 RepID=A0A6M3JZW4_9ZZZZ
MRGFDNSRFYKEILPAMISVADDNNCVCYQDPLSDNIVFKYKVNELKYSIPNEFFYVNLSDGRWDNVHAEMSRAIVFCRQHLKAIEWPWKPEWLKRKELLFMDFST